MSDEPIRLCLLESICLAQQSLAVFQPSLPFALLASMEAHHIKFLLSGLGMR
jgi:hypothetical protein